MRVLALILPAVTAFAFLVVIGPIAVVVLAAIAATLIPAVPLAAGGILLLGCAGVLFANVATAARRR